MFPHLKIGHKLFALVGFCFIALSGYFLWSERQVMQSFSDVVEGDVAAQRLALSTEVRFKLQP